MIRKNERFEINDGIQISYPVVGIIAMVTLMVIWILV